jgi:hypothetical protein
MTPRQAADIIGCSTSTVRQYIRDDIMVAIEIRIPGGSYYEITIEEAERIRDLPKTERRGCPRGFKRDAASSN